MRNKRSLCRGVLVSFAVSLSGAITAAFVPTAYALELDPKEIRGKSSKKNMSVLQNRYFLKAYRPELGLMFGQVLDEAYLSTQIYGLRASLFFNEWLGAEVQFFNTKTADSADRKALRDLVFRPKEEPADAEEGEETFVSPDPEVNPIRGMTDYTVLGTPFYGKLNFLNQWIVYTDIYVALGLSHVDTEQGVKNAILWAVGERFYIGKSWALRADFRDRIYSETRNGKKETKNALAIDLGASYFFN